MNTPLLVAGSVALIGAAVHAVGGEVLVVRRLSPEVLPSSRFGGPKTTKTMIRVSWHVATIAFLIVGAVLILAGSVLHGDTARTIGLVGASASTAFAALLVGTACAHGPRALLRHPGPAVLTAVAALAWWGIAR